MKRLALHVAALTLLALSTLHAQPTPPFAPIKTELGKLNMMRGHIQGIAVTKEAVFASCATAIVKLDWQGNCLKHVSAPDHTGDLHYHDGKLYAALALRKTINGNRGLILVYDTELNLLQQTLVSTSTDGITVRDNTLYFGIGPNPSTPHRGNKLAWCKLPLPDAIPEPEFTVIDHGYETNFGFQNMTTYGDALIGLLYNAKNPYGCIFLDTKLNVTKLLKFHAGNGFDLLPDAFQAPGQPPRFVRCRTLHQWRQTDVNKYPPQLILEFFEFKDDNFKPLHTPQKP